VAVAMAMEVLKQKRKQKSRAARKKNKRTMNPGCFFAFIEYTTRYGIRKEKGRKDMLLYYH
jgi:hypothetical protein